MLYIHGVMVSFGNTTASSLNLKHLLRIMKQNPELTQELLERIDTLAEKVGATAMDFWPKLVQSVKIGAALDLVFGLAGLVMAYIIFKYVAVPQHKLAAEITKEKGPRYYNDEEVLPTVLTVLSGAIIFVVTVISLVHVCSTQTYINLLTPEVGAVRQLLSLG